MRRQPYVRSKYYSRAFKPRIFWRHCRNCGMEFRSETGAILKVYNISFTSKFRFCRVCSSNGTMTTEELLQYLDDWERDPLK